jgi:nitroreductase
MLLDLLKNRCSIRKFQDKPIPQDIIDYMLECGRLSPSGGNEQPWRFGIITDRDLISKISFAAYNQKWIKSSPLLIVLCTTIVEDSRGARNIQRNRFPEWASEIMTMEKELYSKLNLEDHQSLIPGVHFMLAGLEHGIMSTCVSYFNVDEISKLLNLPHLCIPSEILVFGYPDEEITLREKKPKDELVFYNTL